MRASLLADEEGAPDPAFDPQPWDSSQANPQFDLGIEAKATLLVLFRRRRTIFVLTVLAMVVGVVLTFVLPSQYQSRVLLLQSSDNGLASMGLGQAAGLASTLGLNLGTPGVTMAYPDMLESRQIRERLLDRSFHLSNGQEGTLLALLDPDGTSPETQRANALGMLDRRVSVSVDKETGVLELAVTAPDPQLAQEVTKAYVEELIRIEDELQSAAARTNKDFVEQRLAESTRTLRVAEEALTRFRDQNPHMGNDSQLHLQFARLERDVRAQEEVYLALVRELELAKIEVNREAPGVQVIDPAFKPTARSSPILIKNVALCTFFGCIAAALLVLGTAQWSAVHRQLAQAWARDRTRRGWSGQVRS